MTMANSSPPIRATSQSAAQSLLQPRAELLQDLVADGMTERVVDLLEVIDVARIRTGRACNARPFELTREVLAEEAPAAARVRSSVADSLRFSSS